MISVLNQFCGINAKARPTITSGKKKKKRKEKKKHIWEKSLSEIASK